MNTPTTGSIAWSSAVSTLFSETAPQPPFSEVPAAPVSFQRHIAVITRGLSEFGDFSFTSSSNLPALEAQIKTQHAIATTVPSQQSIARALKALGWRILGTKPNANYPPGEGSILTLWHKEFPANAGNMPNITSIKCRGHGVNAQDPPYSFFCCGLWVHCTKNEISRLHLSDLVSPWLKVMVTEGELRPKEIQQANELGWTLFGGVPLKYTLPNFLNFWHNAVNKP